MEQYNNLLQNVREIDLELTYAVGKMNLRSVEELLKQGANPQAMLHTCAPDKVDYYNQLIEDEEDDSDDDYKFEDVVALSALPEHHEVEALPSCVEGDTESPVRSTLTELYAVIIIDYAITVGINVANETWASIWLDLAISTCVSINLCLVLEDTVGLQTIEEWERLACLCT